MWGDELLSGDGSSAGAVLGLIRSRSGLLEFSELIVVNRKTLHKSFKRNLQCHADTRNERSFHYELEATSNNHHPCDRK